MNNLSKKMISIRKDEIWQVQSAETPISQLVEMRLSKTRWSQ